MLGVFRYRHSRTWQRCAKRLAMFRRHGGVERIDLRGFDHAGVVSCMEALAGYTLVGDEMHLADAVYRETDGNPFYVVQMLLHLVETEAIFQDSSGRWVSPRLLRHDRASRQRARRSSVAALVQLGASVERMLNIAAVIGRDFDAELLGRALSVPR